MNPLHLMTRLIIKFGSHTAETDGIWVIIQVISVIFDQRAPLLDEHFPLFSEEEIL